MKTLIIPAAGDGSRLGEYYFPKCLLAVNQRPIIFSIIDYWREYIDQVVVVLNPKTGNLIKKYFEKYFKEDIEVDFCYQPSRKGTYYAIKEGINYSKNKEIILNWSDVLAEEDEKKKKGFMEIPRNLIFTTSNNPCRWEFSNNRFINRGPSVKREGGVVGIFVARDKEKFFTNTPEISDEEIEVLEAMNPENFFELSNISVTDMGDYEKYSRELRCADSSVRAYGSGNKLEIYEDFVIKNTSEGKLKDCESNWYKNCSFNFIPRVLNHNPLVLERIKGHVVADYLDSASLSEEKLILGKFFEILQNIHLSKTPIDPDFDSSYDQYIGKTIKRLENVDFMFNKFNQEKIKINGILYENPLKILKENEEKIKEIFPDKFFFIHGDLQTSNAIVDKNGKIFVIDPRGYFGHSNLFGDPMYDFAKLYYGFCGMWEKFRRGDSKVLFEDNGFVLEPLINLLSLRRRHELFFNFARDISYTVISERKIKILHAIIWLSVADYISNDVLSALYGYLNGTILINEIFKDEKW